MSLVNQMLKDLEQRRAHLPDDDRLHGLRAVSDAQAAPTRPPTSKRWPLLVVIAAVAGSGFGIWLSNRGPESIAPVAQADRTVSVPQSPSADSTTPVQPATVVDRVVPAALASPLETAAVAALETPAITRNDPKPAPTTTVPRTSKPAPRPVATGPTAVAAIATAKPPLMRKTLRAPSPQEEAAQQYNAALQAVTRNEPLQAETALRAALDADPGHVEACTMLATLLLQQDRRDDAARLLAAALERNPRQSRLAMLQARLLADAGQDARAVSVLQAAQAGADADYQALLGALQQRLGNDTQAAAAYRQALASSPQRGTWWLGLAISLERSEQSAAALAAYRNALRDTTLTAQVGDYVRARIAALGRGQG